MKKLTGGMKVLNLALLIQFSLTFVGWCQSPEAANGFLDASKWDFSQKKISLSGSWHFYQNRLLFPEECIVARAQHPSPFPTIWPPEEAINFGTYSLMVAVPPGIETFAVEIPQVYSSYKLWVDGAEIAKNGKVSATKQETSPQWLPQTISFSPRHDTIHFVLQIANFYHAKGGSKDPIYLGKSELMEGHRQVAMGSNLVEATFLTLTGLVFLVLWLNGRKKVVLYFTLLCITWALRSVFSNLYLAINYFPDFDWSVMVKIEYITLYLTMIWAILFLSRLFPLESNFVIKYILVGVSLLFLALTLFTEPIFFTRLLPVYLGFCAFLLGYAVYIILRAWVNDHAGVWFLIISIFLGVTIFAYDFFSYEGLFSYNPIVFSVCYIAIFLLMATSLLFHLNIIKSKPSTALLTYKELYRDSLK